ncbi:MAG: helix-turn-helix domain-containing protein [Lacinutrix sp.]|uniref:helix-turn-helix domain-containing protein n=1 Tax=Lacinutrix sp. TaxID=1937692 RepID=UPI0030A9D893
MTEREIFNYKWIRERIIYYTDVDVLDTRRTRENVNARVVFCKIAREEFWHTWRRIGEYLGKDHATAMHSVKGFEVVKMYEHKFYKAFQMILIELEGEEMIIKHHNLGLKDDIDKEVLDYRESIKNTVEEIKKEAFTSVAKRFKELQNTI